MEQPAHFIQVGDDPAIIGDGRDDLLCPSCRMVLVRGYLPANLLAIDVRCGNCGTVTATPGLPDGAVPPGAIIPVDRRREPLPRPATVANQAALASREEIDRLTRLYSPAPIATDHCVIDKATLDEATADYDRLTGGRFAADRLMVEATGPESATARKSHALIWAIRHLRDAHTRPGWSWFGTDSGSVATTIVAAFRHFVASWSHHPFFSAMAATAADRGFSLHASALFGTAKCLADSGNRVAFPVPDSTGGRIAHFYLAVGVSDRWDVIVEAFDRFEWPDGRSWDPVSLRSTVLESIAASQARINLRRPGLLVLSAGAVRSAFDQPMVDAIGAAVHTHGRRNRGLGAVSVIMPKLIATDQPTAARFSYAFYPVSNRHFAAGNAPQIGKRPGNEPI